MKFFGEKKEIWSQDKPLVDENSKAWNGKEFDSEVVGKSIRKLFHQMSAEKRFVTFIIFRKFLKILKISMIVRQFVPQNL